MNPKTTNAHSGGDAPYPMLKIHSSALAHNLAQFRRLAPKSRILLPVKANAYGCGIGTLFPFFQTADIDILGVANCNEAVEIRQLGWEKIVLNLGGFFPQNIPAIVAHRIVPSITDLWQIGALNGAAASAQMSIHLKLDLGMGRIGIRLAELADLIAALRASPHLKVSGIFTHFPQSGPEAEQQTLAQNEQFIKVASETMQALGLAREDVVLHAANSYSSAFFSQTHHDMIRPGIMFYGYYQSEADRVSFNSRFQLKPCLELTATPISHRTLKKGDGISYASLYHVEKEIERVAVLPLGYADGIPRAMSNRICFGEHALRGRVTMDQIVVGNDIESNEIRLLGEGVPSLEEWGELSQSFSYEIMSHLGNRLRRLLV